MTVAFERITEFDKKSRAIPAMALDISKAIVMVSHAGLLYKFKTYGIPGPVSVIILSFFSNRLFWVVLRENSLQWYLVNATVPQSFVFCPTVFLLYLNGFRNIFIGDIANYANNTSHYCMCDQASDLWQQLELVF